MTSEFTSVFLSSPDMLEHTELVDRLEDECVSRLQACVESSYESLLIMFSGLTARPVVRNLQQGLSVQLGCFIDGFPSCLGDGLLCLFFIGKYFEADFATTTLVHTSFLQGIIDRAMIEFNTPAVSILAATEVENANPIFQFIAVVIFQKVLLTPITCDKFLRILTILSCAIDYVRFEESNTPFDWQAATSPNAATEKELDMTKEFYKFSVRGLNVRMDNYYEYQETDPNSDDYASLQVPGSISFGALKDTFEQSLSYFPIS